MVHRLYRFFYYTFMINILIFRALHSYNFSFIQILFKINRVFFIFKREKQNRNLLAIAEGFLECGERLF